MKTIKLFMASPADLKEERKLFLEVVASINRSTAHSRNFHLEPVIWESHAYPEAENPQKIINQLFEEAEFLVVAFWNKFGASTKNFPSGTMEEFTIAYNKRKATGKPSIKVYFRKPNAPLTSADIEELNKVIKFKESIKDIALYKDYKSVNEFKSLLHEHINGWLTNYKFSNAAIRNKKVKAFTKPTGVRTIIKDSFKKLEKQYEAHGHTNYKFGLKDLDLWIGKWEEANLMLIAGSEGTGKTSLLFSLLRNIMTEKSVTLYFSPRISKTDLIDKLICSEAGVSFFYFRNGYLREHDWPKITRAAGFLSDANIQIDDNLLSDVDDIEKQIKKLSDAHKIGLVIIDGINYLTSNKEVGKHLRIISRKYHVPVVSTLQLHAHNKADERPILGELDKFGDIRTESDIILFLHKKKDVFAEHSNSSFIEMILAKHPGAPLLTSYSLFNKECFRFEDVKEAD